MRVSSRGGPAIVTTARRGLPPEGRAIARRYARALVDVARAQGGGALHELGAELAAFARLVETTDELRQALLRPTLPADARRRVLAALAGRVGASPLLHRLLELVASHDRVELLPAIAEAYTQALDALEDRVRGEAVTAVPLGEAQKTALARALCDAGGKTVELDARLDPGLLGGVLVRLGGRTFDGTVRTRLRALRERLASGR